MAKHQLSKSTYIRGTQCIKSLYLNKHRKDLKNNAGEYDGAVFEQGTDVGILGKQLFPKGVDASPEVLFDYATALAKTQLYIQQKQAIIYEAHFMYNDVLCAVDILIFDGKKYKAIEIKSATSLSDVYIQDAALQYYVLSNSGVPLADIAIGYINNKYVRKGKLNIKKLFTIESILAQAKEAQTEVINNIAQFKKTLNTKKEPVQDIGVHCSSPYGCDFYDHCWQHIPSHSVFDIAGMRSNKKFELYNQGIITFSQITDAISAQYLSEKQALQVTAQLKKRKYINKPNIQAFITDLQFPLYFLDFETINTPVPLFENARPYQQIVFQYSLHCLKTATATAKHTEYLALANGTDPRPNFITQLIKECGTKGDVLTYNMAFEKTRLKELCIDFPEYSIPLQSIIDRMKDLMLPFAQRWYYTPKMQGSYSIKYVLPALVPKLSYTNLTIQNGSDAMNIYAAMASGTFTGNVAQTRKALLAYCCMDTFAMVKIWEVLREV
jgi:hypothetical protein